MSNFTSSGTTQECHFSNRKRWEVVVKHEALLGFAFEPFKPLHVVACAQRRSDKRLGFATREYRRAVSAGQNADFDRNVANLIECASIGTTFLMSHRLAENAFAKSFVISFQLSFRLVIIFG